MDKKVVDLDSQRPHKVGQFLCVNCSYTAISVIQLDAKLYNLECPQCHEMKGAHIIHQELWDEFL